MPNPTIQAFKLTIAEASDAEVRFVISAIEHWSNRCPVAGLTLSEAIVARLNRHDARLRKAQS